MNVGNLFNFSGRIGRGEYLLRGIVSLFALFLIASFSAAIDSSGPGMVLVIPAYLAMLVVGLSSGVKRWHDRGRSGAWVLLSLIPFVGGLWTLVELCFLPGTDGVNEYGLSGSGSATHEPELEYDVIPSRYS